MTPTQTQQAMLKRIGQAARNAQFFTESSLNYQATPEKIVRRNLDELEQAGYLALKANGAYRLTQMARDYLAGAGRVVECAKVTNGTSRLPYIPPAWTPARAEADDHKRHSSLEYAPQIVRVI